MRKTDVAYLLCVGGFAAWIAGRSITLATAYLPGSAATVPAAVGAAGQSRDVDVRQLQRLIDRGTLSDHEAEFYELQGAMPPDGRRD